MIEFVHTSFAKYAMKCLWFLNDVAVKTKILQVNVLLIGLLNQTQHVKLRFDVTWVKSADQNEENG